MERLSQDRLESIRLELLADDIPLPQKPFYDEDAARRYFEQGGELPVPPCRVVPGIGTSMYPHEDTDTTELELPAPPELPDATLSKPSSASDNMDATSVQLHFGIQGSSHPRYRELLHMLATEGSRPSFEASFLLYEQYLARRLMDKHWVHAFAHAAETIASDGGADGGEATVCVLGLGTGVPALVAARHGARVIWAERCPRLAARARRLARRNALAPSRLAVVECREWTDLSAAALLRDSSGGDGAGSGICGAWFDAVITEEFDEGDLAEGAPHLAHLGSHASAQLLWPSEEGRPPRGRMVPHAVMLMGQLCSLRTQTICGGLDLRAMNAFRGASTCTKSDLEHLVATDAFMRQQPRTLSAPFEHRQVAIASGSTPGPAPVDAGNNRAGAQSRTLPTPMVTTADASRTHEAITSVRAVRPGVLNCVATWAVVDLGGGCLYSAAPDWARPLPATHRALCQSVHFLGCERLLAAEEIVPLRLSSVGGMLDVVIDPAAASGAIDPKRQVMWPRANAFACAQRLSNADPPPPFIHTSDQIRQPGVWTGWAVLTTA